MSITLKFLAKILQYIMSGFGNNIHSFYQFVSSCLPRLLALILQYCEEKKNNNNKK